MCFKDQAHGTCPSLGVKGCFSQCMHSCRVLGLIPPSKRTPALYLWMREAEGGVAAAALHQEEGTEKEMRQTNEQHHQGPTEEDEGQESWNLTRGAERGPGEARQGYPNAVR